MKLWIWFNRVLQVFQHCLSIVPKRSVHLNLSVTSHQIHAGKGYKQKSYKVAYPPLRSGWFWFIFNLNSTAKAASCRPCTRSVKTLLPPPIPEALAEASLFKILTCKITTKVKKQQKNIIRMENGCLFACLLQRKYGRVILLCLMRIVWRERNNWTFEGVELSVI